MVIKPELVHVRLQCITYIMTFNFFQITQSYNKLSPQKRSTKVLRAKFHNMKTMARKIGIKNYLKDLNYKRNKPTNDNTQVR